VNQPDTNFWDKLGWTPSQKQFQQFLMLQTLLKEWNSKISLTKLTDGPDYWVGHIFDSLWALQNELKSPNYPRRCIDVGTGCGLPGLAVAIALSGAKVTLVDATKRKISVLEEISAKLGLSNQTSFRAERIEITGQNPHFRTGFDLAMARAVGSPSVVAEYLIPLLNKTGEALLFRGNWNETDLCQLKSAILPLKAEITKTDRIQLPFNKGIRHVIRLQSNALCPPKYPRPIGVPSKKPLGI